MLRIALIAVAFLTIFALSPTSAQQKNPQSNVVLMQTLMGDIKIELFPDKAPITVKNFLDYVDDKHYDNTIFHRIIPTFMIQGGGMDQQMKQKKTKPPIKNESTNGLSNARGTIAMARTGVPDSATCQFFINVVDNTRLDSGKTPDGVGYCVFGQVIEGMDVADKIKAVKTGAKDAPVEQVLIKSVRRLDAK